MNITSHPIRNNCMVNTFSTSFNRGFALVSFKRDINKKDKGAAKSDAIINHINSFNIVFFIIWIRVFLR